MNCFENLIDKLPSWLRWILVLPLALISAYVVCFILFNLAMFTLPNRNSTILFFDITILEYVQILSNGYFCWCFLKFCYVIAPHHKNETLIALAVISSVLISAPIIVGVVNGRFSIITPTVLSDVAYVVTAIYACCKIANLNSLENKSNENELFIPKIAHSKDNDIEIAETETIKNMLHNVPLDKVEYSYEDEEEGTIKIPKSFFDIKLENAKKIDKTYDEINKQFVYTFISNGNKYKVVVKE